MTAAFERESTVVMNDEQVWDFEKRLWVGGREAYDEQVSEQVLMALPAKPYLYDRAAAIEAVKATPVWDEADFADEAIERHGDGLLVVGYRVKAKSGDRDYHALCSSTILEVEAGKWRVIQHQQTPFGMEVSDPNNA